MCIRDSSPAELRAMYAGGRGNDEAREWARFWARVNTTKLLPQRWVTLEVPGRKSGAITRFPLGMARYQGNWYLVSMLGECNWTRNVRAADGLVTLRGRHTRRCRLIEVPPDDRAPILKRYLAQVPGARPHLPVDRTAPIASFIALGPTYPVFRVVPEP